jgi:hypothetical protein
LVALSSSSSCSRHSSSPPDAGALVFTAVPPLPAGDPKLPRWEEQCMGEPRSRYTDWVDVLVVTPDHRCFKDKRRASPQVVLDTECLSDARCGVPIQCPPAGAPLVPNACYHR